MTTHEIRTKYEELYGKDPCVWSQEEMTWVTTRDTLVWALKEICDTKEGTVYGFELANTSRPTRKRLAESIKKGLRRDV